MKFAKSLFIFRRDLRLVDNTGLNDALKYSKQVIACFIFDPRQVESKLNKYKSNNAIQFMIESLVDLDTALRKHHTQLYFFYGKAEEIVEKLIASEKIDAVVCNRDYTPFSIRRDSAIAQVCKQYTVAFAQAEDALLNAPEKITKKDGLPYAIFTAFYKKATTFSVEQPQKLHEGSWFCGNISYTVTQTLLQKIVPHANKKLACHGGTAQALVLLKQLCNLKQYQHDHDYPSRVGTSHLSAYLKFGTISVRQAYQAISEQLSTTHPLLRQLYWRDFFTHIAFHTPSVFGHSYHKKYDTIAWNYDKKMFAKWCEGKTGFPIIDAGMRELNTTGFMHNRVRMIVASFLVKDLHIDWQWGEKYFAQKLVDYDPAINNGNWQWCASTGCDAQPYFRIFNPWLQQKRFDLACVYIKNWIPELRNIENKIIHNWFKEKVVCDADYPKPILDHAKESMIAKAMYRCRS
jgi:deoxyribodipyrimidine photo-lyase